MKDRKLFSVDIGDKKVELAFRNPNQEELLALDLEYRKIFSQCLREGVMSEAEARKIAEKNGVWTKDDEKRVTELAVQVSILENIVNNENGKCTSEQIKEAVEKLPIVRSEMLNLVNQKVEIILSNSAEGLARDQRMHKFVLFCCVTPDGNRFFDKLSSYEKFAIEHKDALSEIFKRSFYYEFGDPEKLTEDWAEVKYLKNKVKEIEAEQKQKEEATKFEFEEEKKPRKKKEKEVEISK